MPKPLQEPPRPAIARTVARFEAFQHRLMAAHAEEFTSVDLTMAQAKLLYVVMAAGELRLGDIADRLRVTASTASGAVDHLVGLGMLSRSEDPTNRRQIRVSITPLGLATIERISELGTRQMTALFELMSDADLDVVHHAIEIISEAIDAREASTSTGTATVTGTSTAPTPTPRSPR